MPDPERSFLGIPEWFWNSAFMKNLVHYILLGSIAVLGYSANSKLTVNGEHAEAQLKKSDKVIAKQEEVKEAIEKNIAETAQVKVATQATAQIVEQKAAQSKPESGPPGL